MDQIEYCGCEWKKSDNRLRLGRLRYCHVSTATFGGVYSKVILLPRMTTPCLFKMGNVD